MKKSAFRKIAPAAALLTAALGSAALAQEPKTTFTIVNTSPITGKNYNPYTPASQHLSPTLTIYESLFYINTNSGKVDNVLGTKYAWSKDNKTLTVTTRPNVKWTDNQAFTAADVEFSFNYVKTNPALDLTGIWKSGLGSVKASGANTVVFSFNKVNTPFFFYIAHLPIVPQHLWKDVKDPATFANPDPVGTGPFVAETYTAQAIRALKNPNYWMKGAPHMDAVVWLSTNGNDAALLKLLKNEADYSFVSVPDPNRDYKNKGAQYSYWYVPNGVNALYFNTTRAPFSDPAFRKALSFGVNTKDVALKAYAGVVPVADPTGVLPSQLGQWKPANLASISPKFDLAAADKMLSAAGYKKNAQGVRLGKDGKALPTYRILVGSGWTDFITMAQVIGTTFKQLGIDTQIDQQVYASYAGTLQSATFDMGVSWGWGGGPTPYNLYYQSFDPSFSAAPGKTSASNLSRYTNPAVTQAIDAFSATSSLAVQKKAAASMITQVLKDAPWVPLTARTSFNVYNNTHFTNFPDDQNPYNDGNASDTVSGRVMLLNVKPK